MNVRTFSLTIEELRYLETKLRQAGLSARDALKAIAVVKKWLQRDAEEPESTPSDLVVPGEPTTHP